MTMPFQGLRNTPSRCVASSTLSRAPAWAWPGRPQRDSAQGARFRELETTVPRRPREPGRDAAAVAAGKARAEAAAGVPWVVGPAAAGPPDAGRGPR